MHTDPADTDRLLSYLSGNLSIDAIRELEQRLLHDNTLRKQLLELSTEEVALTDWARSEGVSASLDESAFVREGVSQVPARGSSSRVRKVTIGYLAAAAVFLLGLSGVLWLGQPQQPLMPGVALLVSSVDADWQDLNPAPGASLPIGRYQLTSGSVDLLFSEGAKVSLGGPAEFELKSVRHLHLENGQMVARISDEALGFIVTSPHSEVIDLGTEFGLAVDQAGMTDVHVIDGLVEVLPSNSKSAAAGVTIAEGNARRFGNTPGAVSNEIPVATRESLLGVSHVDDLGLELLRGSVRISGQLSVADFIVRTDGRNWIDLIPEKRGALLSEPLTVSINATGSYRNFESLSESLPSNTKLDSYLLHFRPGNLDEVRGVIRFDRPVVGIMCVSDHLYASDELFGVPAVVYPKGMNPFRGLEPNGRPTLLNSRETDPDWQPDEIVLSQDRHTISIRTFANTARGYDQVRVLTLAE